MIEVAAMLDEVALDRELVRRVGLRKFIALAWPVVESAAFVPSWHIDAIAEHLSAVSTGDIDRLVINVPPGCSKSIITSVLWPAWQWTFEPSHKWMTATFDAALARRDALRMRALLKHDWYLSRWPRTRINDSPDVQATMGIYHTTAGGFRYSTTTGGGATGWHCHTQIVDDPTKPADLAGEPEAARAVLDRDWEWWRGTMASRRADPTRFARVVIMQRLHEADLAQRCIEEGYTHLMLPMRHEPERRCVTIWGGKRHEPDPRTRPGELLCPARFDEAAVTEAERDMGPTVAAAQFQQRPAPASGAIFKRDWLMQEWLAVPDGAQYVQSWDCAFKATSDSDYVVGQVWAVKGSQFFLVDQVRARMDLPATCAAIRSFSAKWPKARTKYVEDKANGPAVEQTLRKDITGIVMVNPEGGKVSRANAVTPFFAAGNVFLPPPTKAPWVHDWREELASFPMAAHDDQVDAATQALIQLDGKRSRFGEAMSKIKAAG